MHTVSHNFVLQGFESRGRVEVSAAVGKGTGNPGMNIDAGLVLLDLTYSIKKDVVMVVGNYN